MVKLVDVSKYYNSNGIVTIALEHVYLEFKKNDIVAITGESGSGKSTLLNIICGNDSYDEGEIYFQGNETSYFDVSDLDSFRNKYVGFIYQNYNIIDSYTALQNVMMPLILKGVPKKEAKLKAKELLKKVGLENRIRHRGTKLSGGEKQRVVIARALACDPEILACDEPTGNLDSNTAREIIDLIKEIAKDKLVLIVTHNYEQVKDIATRKVTLVDGKVIEDRVIKEVEETKNKEMILDKTKMKFKDILYFTKNNLFSTPKKTLFSFLVIAIMFFTFLYIFQSINYSFLSSEYTYSIDGNYFAEDYVVVNKGISSTFTEEELETISELGYITNYYNIIDNMLFASSSGISVVAYLPTLPEYTNLYGDLPSSEDECILLVPSSGDRRYYLEYIGESIMVGSSDTTYTLVGVANCEYISYNTIVSYNNDSETILNNTMSFNSFNFQSIGDLDCYVSVYYSEDYTIPHVLVPYGYNFTGIKLKILDTYLLDIEYDYEYSSVSNVTVILPSDYNISDLGIFEIGIFGVSSNTIRELEKMGFSIYLPSEYNSLSIINIMAIALLSLLCLMPVLVVYLVVYLVVRTIYRSKYRQYTIMRTLGIDRSSMSKIILSEIFSLSFISAIVVFILGIILGKGFGVMTFYYINSYIVLIFFALAFIFSIGLSLRVNNRLFRYAAARMLKESD